MRNSTGVESVVRVRNLHIRRGTTSVLRGLNCNLSRGSITGLLGPSGCGKTTLMRAILGVQRITSGSIEILGLPAGAKALRHKVAYTSQALSIYPDISVHDNVTYFARLVGADSADVEQAIRRVQLTDYAARPITKLSGGQANRASLACALVGHPEVLVLDEPTVGLDPITRQELWQVFRGFAAEGVTLLISSHVMDEASHCDEVLFMREGEFLAQESIESVQDRTGTDNPEEAFLALIKESV
ncbi:ABC transporter ATP-binding protein [Actinotignum schaalii]|uniref:ABC transporter ATP-binding protein n=1 Tax=Actinomycetaceae TaxID=2049 RepID=UPI00237E640C|nr:ABC transporter ATP-binding protein [Actinotignum schaalii]MDE1654097.1 ABC transporter ATP-binding protein [Actinotignum schaalii]